MTVLTIRTDKPEAELGLYMSMEKIAYLNWSAHRELSPTIHIKIDELLNKSSITIGQVQGLVIYKGPGSFTGLRIGFSVANAMANAYAFPIIASSGEHWIKNGIADLRNNKTFTIALPEYGKNANITVPRK